MNFVVILSLWILQRSYLRDIAGYKSSSDRNKLQGMGDWLSSCSFSFCLAHGDAWVSTECDSRTISRQVNADVNAWRAVVLSRPTLTHLTDVCAVIRAWHGEVWLYRSTPDNGSLHQLPHDTELSVTNSASLQSRAVWKKFKRRKLPMTKSSIGYLTAIACMRRKVWGIMIFTTVIN